MFWLGLVIGIIIGGLMVIARAAWHLRREMGLTVDEMSECYTLIETGTMWRGSTAKVVTEDDVTLYSMTFEEE